MDHNRSDSQAFDVHLNPLPRPASTSGQSLQELSTTFLGSFKHLKTDLGLDDPKVMRMNIACLCRGGRLHHVAGRTPAGAGRLGSIVMLRMHADGPGVRKPFVLAMARETEVVIVVGPGQLGPAGSSVGVVAVETENFGIEVSALLKIEPLLVVGLGMRLGSPQRPGLN
jgi:hypothetical protein